MTNNIIDDEPMTAAEFLATREALHLPQQFFAKRLSVGRETVSRWERGQYEIPQYAANEILHQVSYRQKVVAEIVANLPSDTPGIFIVPLGDGSECSECYPASWYRGVAYEAQRFTRARIMPESLARELGLYGRERNTPNVAQCDIAVYLGEHRDGNGPDPQEESKMKMSKKDIRDYFLDYIMNSLINNDVQKAESITDEENGVENWAEEHYDMDGLVESADSYLYEHGLKSLEQVYPQDFQGLLYKAEKH